MNNVMKMGLLLLFTSRLFATDLIPNNSTYYYEIGGAGGLAVPPVKRDMQIDISGNLSSRMDFVCNFNPVVSITNTLNDIKSSINGMPENIVNNLKVGALSYPAYKLSQSFPRFYNMIQNETLNGRETFNLSMKDCNDIRHDLKNGVSPYEDYFKISDSQGWLDAVKEDKNTNSVDINQRKKDIANNREKYGIPWVHPGINSGGSAENQKPIKVISDVVIAGYNVLASPQRSIDDLSDLAEDNEVNLPRFWKNPKEASDWAVMVLGDIKVSLSDKPNSKDTTAGIGLATIIETCPKIGNNLNTCVRKKVDDLWLLVDGTKTPTPANLRPLSASSLVITPEVIDTVMHMDREMQILTVNKLAQEIAVQNLLDEAFMLKRILQAGFQIQAVQNLAPARRMVKNAIDQLNSDIRSLSFEHQIRKQMIGSTLKTVMDIRNDAKSNHAMGYQSTQPITENGAVYKPQGVVK